jgi:hypothetical protein
MNRREFVQTTAATALTSALPLTAFAVSTVTPVAYVWMGQILLDYSGTQQAYLPPTGYSQSG